jgi:hypothetical protein
VERSITQPTAQDATGALKVPGLSAAEGLPESDDGEPEAFDEEYWDEPWWAAYSTRLWGISIVLFCLIVYFVSQPVRNNNYLHFVLQAQAWLDGKTAIPMPQYQDVMPILDPNGNPTGYGIIPFPPLPAWVLMPFVAIWHLATNQQLLATFFSAVDVGLAYWMLGFLPIKPSIRIVTTIFFGLGTVLWFTAATGSTWFWAHVVAVFCLLLAVGLALRADRDASEPQPLSDFRGAVHGFKWPGGWRSLALLAGLGVMGESMFILDGTGTTAASMASVGVILSLIAAVLAVVVAGRPGALAPFVIAVAVGAGLPLLLFAGQVDRLAIVAFDLGLMAVVAVLWWLSRQRGSRVDRALESFSAALSAPETMQVAAGILFGLAVTARLTILMGFPFLMLVGGGGTWMRRSLLAGAGVAVPLVTLLVVTYATSGHLFNPAYDYLYHYEVATGAFNYNPDWSITDIRYIPQNLGIMLFSMPRILPDFYSIYPSGAYGTQLCTNGATRGIFNPDCPLMMPDAIGTSLILTSPAFLLAPLAWRPIRDLHIDRVTVGCSIAVVAIAIVNLMHFSQGWVQFGYRFSNDFVPFALILVALGASRLGRLWPLVLLVAISILVNLWGTTWGVILAW